MQVEEEGGVMENTILAEGDFTAYENPRYVPLLIEVLLSKSTIIETQLNPVGDDRMFVLCWYGDDALPDEMKIYEDAKGYSYLSHDWWYQFIFVDGGISPSCQ